MFDPYHKWLGIPPHKQPATFYQILAISPDEQDPDVIEEAAIRQTSHVRTYQTGPYAAESTKLLNQIAMARTVLLDHARREEYDQWLNETTAAREAAAANARPAASSPPPVPQEGFDWNAPASPQADGADLDHLGSFSPLAEDTHPAAEVEEVTPVSRRQPPRKNRTMLMLVGAAFHLFGAALVVYILFFRGKNDVPEHPPAHKTPAKEEAKVPSAQPSRETRPNPNRPPVVNPAPKPVKKGPNLDDEEPFGREPPARQVVGPISTLHGHTSAVSSLAFSPLGRRAVSGSFDGNIRIWDVEMGTTLRSVTPSAGEVLTVAISPPDGRIVLGAGRKDSMIHIWDIKTGKELRPLAGHADSVFSVTFSPDGRQALSGGKDKVMRLWDVKNGKEIRTLPNPGEEGHSGWIRCVAFSPDGKRALSASIEDMSLRYWDLSSGDMLKVFEAGPVGIWCVTFCPDGMRALFGCSDGTIRLWDLDNWRELRRIKAHNADVTGVALLPDGRALSSSRDKTLCLWDLETKRLQYRFSEHEGEVACVAVSPEGRRAISGGADHEIRVWGLPAPGTVRPSLNLNTNDTKPPDKVKPPVKPAPPPPVVKRSPVPAADAQAEAEKLIRKVHKADYAKTDPEHVLSLAVKLTKQADNSESDSAERFVLLREARDLAAKAGNAPATLQAIDAMARLFAIDVLEMKADALTEVNRTASEIHHRVVTGSTLSVALDAVAASKSDLAIRLLNLAQDSAREAKSRELMNRVDAIKTVAKKDLAHPKDPEAQLDLGNSWWDHATGEGKGKEKNQMLWRARYWYEQALPKLPAGSKAKIENRLKDIDNLAPDPTKAAAADWSVNLVAMDSGFLATQGFFPRARQP